MYTRAKFAVDHGDVAGLVLLDLSAAFDTVDHDILLQRLRVTFGITDVVHRWIRSYLSGRSQHVRRGQKKSTVTRLMCDVPQGSVLGPILFVLYTVDLISLIESHGLSAHLYADDTQVYGSCRPADVVSFSTRLSRCVDEASGWMKSNRLQSNPDKAEVLWCATSRRQNQLPTTALLIDGAAVDPVKSVRDLGIYIDSDLVMRTHVKRTVSRCFAALRQLRQIRRSVPPATFQSLVVTLVLSRLDYGNAVVGLPAYLVRRLQSVLNAAARLAETGTWLAAQSGGSDEIGEVQQNIAILFASHVDAKVTDGFYWVGMSRTPACRPRRDELISHGFR